MFILALLHKCDFSPSDYMGKLHDISPSNVKFNSAKAKLPETTRYIRKWKNVPVALPITHSTEKCN